MMTQSRKIVTLRSVVRTLQSSRHARRAVFLVGSSGCVPHLPQDQWGECRDLVKEAREADVPFYILDPRQFIDADVTAAASPEERASATANESSRRDEMMTLASATGGRTSSRAGNPARAAADAIAENGTYYLLGFYPDPPPSDGRFHEIHVAVTRPGLRVRARPGYIAASPPARPSTPVRDMTGRLGAGVDDPGLPVRIFAAPLGPAPGGRTRTLVTLEIAYPLAAAEGALDEDLRVGILALTPDAKIKASFQRSIHFAGGLRQRTDATFVVNETRSRLRSSRCAWGASLALARSGDFRGPPDLRQGPDARRDPIERRARRTRRRARLAAGIAPFQPTIRRTFAAGDTPASSRGHSGSGCRHRERDDPTRAASAARTLALPGRPAAGGGREAISTELPLAGPSRCLRAPCRVALPSARLSRQIRSRWPSGKADDFGAGGGNRTHTSRRNVI